MPALAVVVHEATVPILLRAFLLLLVGPDEGLTRAQREPLRGDPRIPLTGHVSDVAPI